MADGAPVEDRDELGLLEAIARMERDPLQQDPSGDDYVRRQDAIAEMMEAE